MDNRDLQQKKATFWQKTIVWLPLTLLCVFLWGTAFPAVKSGYELFQINNQDPDSIYSLLLFAGARFALSGILTIVFVAAYEKINPWPQGTRQWRDIFALGMLQTALQYGFFFVGLANTSGTVGSILASTSSFMTIILAAVFFKNERMTKTVLLGCLLGFIGVVLIDFKSGTNLGFNWLGDGLMLLSSLTSAFSIILIKKLTVRNHPSLLSGWNFLIGGLILMSVGLAGGGSLQAVNFKAWFVLFYLALLTAVAYSLWSTMLKYHEVSKLSVYKSLIPVIGAVGSAVILKENIWQPRLMIALLLVVSGIQLVNYKKKDMAEKSI